MNGNMLLQAGSGGIVGSAVGFITPIVDAVIAVLGIAFWVSLVFLVYYAIEAYAHPTPFGRSARLAAIYDHVKAVVWSIVAIYLAVAFIAFAVNKASGSNVISVSQLFYFVFVEPVVKGFSLLFGTT